ncbi:NAD(P)-dependent oxidoreductase [Roseomonas hellenica]|uniref:NAD(P)-dependent oxidoreductase n=1 Tax=Plastoroseomonas hellenica TaxID=2687306 RepID=A0ABS5F151_9PROT|nr:NAD(P)-dependent oxidoreductase [Plastoroseomonas hellenica]MBR0666287.1 NAD(P)-dependent oxidoreductase [Plastoroseomonas hellenica]
MSAQRILVVGGSGFVGGRLLRLAMARGVAVASFGPGEAPREDGVARFDGRAEVPGELLRALREFRPDALIWAAGHNPGGDGLARSATEDPARAVAVNAGGFAAALAAAAVAEVGRVVQCGSTVVYGPPALYGTARVDEAAPPAPRSTYGLSKHMAEMAADWAAHALGLSVTTLRLPLVLGPGRWYVGAAALHARMLRAAAGGAPFDDAVPDTPFDAVHGDDAAEALLMLAGLPQAPRRLNMAGLTLDHAGIAAALERIAGPGRVAARAVQTPAELPLVDDSALRGLGWQPRHDLEAILTDTLREMMSKESA